MLDPGPEYPSHTPHTRTRRSGKRREGRWGGSTHCTPCPCACCWTGGCCSSRGTVGRTEKGPSENSFMRIVAVRAQWVGLEKDWAKTAFTHHWHICNVHGFSHKPTSNRWEQYSFKEYPNKRRKWTTTTTMSKYLHLQALNGGVFTFFFLFDWHPCNRSAFLL